MITFHIYRKSKTSIYIQGGGRNIRGIWYKYFVDVHGVIFVVDSCDSERFHEVQEVLEEILSSDKITGKPLLVLANKQDKESAFDEIDIIECLKIEELVNRYKCPALVQSCWYVGIYFLYNFRKCTSKNKYLFIYFYL